MTLPFDFDPHLARQSPSTVRGAKPMPSPITCLDECTRPADVPTAREHPLSGTLLYGTDMRLDVRVGRGASALVYRATRGRGGSSAAVKVLHSHSQGAVHDGLHREVQILQQIDSPWVVKVEGEGVLPDGRPWYAMEYIDGRSLATILGTTAHLEPARVVGWLRGACRGLAAIHAVGWVHRDVKPGNLVVVDIGGYDAVKIVDLGIAERIGAKPRALSGTPDYIAPEQAELGPVDVRSDVYALGCCAYELLSGRRVVEGESSFAKIDAHIRGLRLQWPEAHEILPALRELVERCVARQPDARPPQMSVLELELARVADALVGVTARKAEQRRSIARSAVTEVVIGWPHPAAYLSLANPPPQRPRRWSRRAKTMPTALNPGACPAAT